MIKICTQCNGLGYTEEEKVYPIFFLPNVGYTEVVKKNCEECSDVRDNTKRSGNVKISSANSR